MVYIFDSSLEEEQINERLVRFHQLLVTPEQPEPITNINRWGKRTLAYPVKRRETGYYVVAQFQTRPSALAEFERALKLEEGLLRFLLVVNEGEAPRPPAPARSFGDGDESDEGPVVPGVEE